MMSRDGMDSDVLNSVASLLEVSFEKYLSDVKPYLTTAQVNALFVTGSISEATAWTIFTTGP
jgi:hypothetical protein